MTLSIHLFPQLAATALGNKAVHMHFCVLSQRGRAREALVSLCDPEHRRERTSMSPCSKEPMSTHPPAPGSCTGLVLRADSAGNYLIKQNRECHKEAMQRSVLDLVEGGLRSC